MSAIRWILGSGVFLLLLLFSLQNAQPVEVKFYGLFVGHAPLVFLLLAAFATGVAAGLLAGVMRTVRLNRQISRMRREHAMQVAGAASPLDTL